MSLHAMCQDNRLAAESPASLDDYGAFDKSSKNRVRKAIADIVWDVEGTDNGTACETTDNETRETKVALIQPQSGEIPERLPAPALPTAPASPAPSLKEDPSTEKNKSSRLSDIQFSELLDPTGLDEESSAESNDASAVPQRDPYFGSSSRIHFMWTARDLSHRTLYFDDMPAERLGQSYSDVVQPLASTCEFLKDFFLFPCRWPHDRCGEFHYTLGLARPGSPSPSLRERKLTTR